MNRIMNVYASGEPAEEFSRLDGKDAFNLAAIDDTTVLNIGGIELTFKKMKHPSLDYAVKAVSEGRTFVFSGDTSWTENIIEFAAKADLLMLDAGLLARDKTNPDVPHLTAEECGIAAQRAGAGKLLLTHFWPEYDPKELVAEAAAHFTGVEAAELLATYSI
jgi:ribonuclease BN (tRNA processing enzyme)